MNLVSLININKQRFEPYSELVDTALQNFRNDYDDSRDSPAQQENDEVHELMETLFNKSINLVSPFCRITSDNFK